MALSQGGVPGAESGETILLVEDHFDTRWVTAEYLRSAGFRVIEATSAVEAVTILDSGMRVDLLFSDINLPGVGNGYTLARLFAEKRPGIPILLTSGGAEDPKAYAKGPLAQFLRKPYAHTELDSLMRGLLAAGRRG